MSSPQTIQPNQTAESESKPRFPPNVVIYIRAEIDRRTEYKKELERVPIYEGFDDFKRRRINEQKKTLEYQIANLTKNIVAITKKHFPSIETDPDNDEITISNVLAVLPAPEDVVVKKIYHSNQGQSPS
jgi:hypothetical protein